MSERLSKGPIQVVDNGVLSLNYALQQVQNEIDEIRGLRGRATLYDRVRVEDPTESKDAINLVAGDIRYLQPGGGRMTYGTESVFYTDVNGTVLHGFGNL